MAKTGNNTQQILEQHFDVLIKNNWYYNEVYLYLLKYENEFTNTSLIEFILNCSTSTNFVNIALRNPTLTTRSIINNKNLHQTIKIYDNNTKYELNEFELYLTKFIVAHALVKYYKEDENRTNYFNQILAITKNQNNTFKYFFEYHKGYYCTGNDLGVCNDWHLRLNTEHFVIINKMEYTEIINKLNQSTTQIIPQQNEIEPIDSTLHQQFLIFHYLFKYLEISTNSVDKTKIARFIQFATQKQLEAKKIQNTTIYKLVENPFNGYKKEQGTTQTNLQKVRELFENIGLKTIAEIVSKDII